MRALSSLLYSISRIPGLGFLNKIAQSLNKANYAANDAKRNVENVKRSSNDLRR